MASYQQGRRSTLQPSGSDQKAGQRTASQQSRETGAARGSVPGDQMASDQFKRRPVRKVPVCQEGEDVLIFQGLKMRKAQCVWVAVEGQRVRYLVRYPPQGDTSPASRGFVACPGKPFWRPSGAWAPPTPRDPAMPLGTGSEGSYSQFMDTGRGTFNFRNPGLLPVVPQIFSKQPLYPTSPLGWDYEWIPEGSVLRYSAAFLQRDQPAYVLLHIAAEKQKPELECPISLIQGSYYCNSGESSTSMAEGSMMQSLGGMGRPLPQGRGSRLGTDTDAIGGLGKEPPDSREIQIHLPIALKSLFLQDWSLVTLEKKLFKVPAKRAVYKILIRYATFQPNCRSFDQKCAISGLVAVIKEYFDLLLATQLLHDFERSQYSDIVAHNPILQMSQIYGGAHLLRLIPKLGPILACSPLSDSCINVFMSHLQDFLEYLAKDPSQLFTPAADYQLTSA